MRKIALLAVALSLVSGLASAQVRSHPTSFTDSNLDVNVTANGHIVSAAVFTIPSASVTIPLGTVSPGMTFTLDIPVSNPSNDVTLNPVNVTMAYSGSIQHYQNYFTLTPTSATSFHIDPGATVDVTYQVKVSDTLPKEFENTNLAGGEVAYTFSFTAHGAVPAGTHQGDTYIVGSGSSF